MKRCLLFRAECHRIEVGTPSVNTDNGKDLGAKRFRLTLNLASADNMFLLFHSLWPSKSICLFCNLEDALLVMGGCFRIRRKSVPCRTCFTHVRYRDSVVGIAYRNQLNQE